MCFNEYANNDLPSYASPFEFIEGLAALTSLFKHEALRNRKTHVRTSTGESKCLRTVLWSGASPDRVEWYFNNARIRTRMPIAYVSMLSSGTSSNEALHREANRWFSNQPELFIQTLTHQLEVCTVAKLMAHNASLYSPQLRGFTHQTILAALAANWRFDINGDWAKFLATPVTLQGAAAKVATRKAIKALERPRRILSKRPVAAFKKIVRPMKRIKRHALNLERVKL